MAEALFLLDYTTAILRGATSQTQHSRTQFWVVLRNILVAENYCGVLRTQRPQLQR